MALRNQPYFPFYVNDYMNDEKLNECSAESAGVYTRIMCIMHKSEEYGVILLNQKDKQTDSKVKNFAYKLAKHMPYTVDVIERSLDELIYYGVIQLEGDKLSQKRMIKDNYLSEIRAKAGKKGGDKTSFAKAKNIANSQANSENENENINKDVIINKKGGAGGGKKFIPPTLEEIQAYCKERNNNVDPKKFYDFFNTGDWIDSKGEPVRNWKQKVITWEGRNKKEDEPPEKPKQYFDRPTENYDHLAFNPFEE